jgi:light-regulated signal transduction histidine kinase (bacteriophytochrome)
MATGTGKTRVAMALIDVFLRSHQAQKVLFLADRDALVDQTLTDGFKAHLPHEPRDRIYTHQIDALRPLRPHTTDQRVDLSLRYGPETPRCLVGDAGRIRQVVLNLAGNALKFTERGHVLIRVDHQAEPDNHVWLKIAVEDTGIGIPEQQQRAIFDKLVQADASKIRGHRAGALYRAEVWDMDCGRVTRHSEIGPGNRQPGEAAKFRAKLRILFLGCRLPRLAVRGNLTEIAYRYGDITRSFQNA